MNLNAESKQKSRTIMDVKLIRRALKHHGPNLVRELEDEQQEPLSSSLLTHVDKKSAAEPEIKDESFQDKLRKFIAKKSDLLFKTVDRDPKQDKPDFIDDSFAIMPPLETFMGLPNHLQRAHFYQCLRPDDCVTGVVAQILESGMLIRILCVDKHQARDVENLDILGYCPAKELPKLYVKESALDAFQEKDIVRGIVLSVSAETERIIISLHNKSIPEGKNYPRIGLITEDEFPVFFRRKSQIQDMAYWEMLPSIFGYNNAGNVGVLREQLHIPKTCSYLRFHARLQVPEKEYAEGLKKWQSQKLAHKSVAQGVDQFKQGNFLEAMQHLSRALQIDPGNVEALVARGALHANKENFNKAIQDFEEALSINPKHSNARNYLVETLLAYGKSCEESRELEDAVIHFEHALKIDPENTEARELLETCNKLLALQGPSKVEESKAAKLDLESVLSPPDTGDKIKKSKEASLLIRSAEKLKQLIKEDKEKQARKRSKKKHRRSRSSSRSSNRSSRKKKRKRRRSSSSGSRSGSNSRSSSGSDGSRGRGRKKEKESRKSRKRRRSSSKSDKDRRRKSRSVESEDRRERRKERENETGRNRSNSAKRTERSVSKEGSGTRNDAKVERKRKDSSPTIKDSDLEALAEKMQKTSAASFLPITSYEFFSKNTVIPGLGSPPPSDINVEEKEASFNRRGSGDRKGRKDSGPDQRQEEEMGREKSRRDQFLMAQRDKFYKERMSRSRSSSSSTSSRSRSRSRKDSRSRYSPKGKGRQRSSNRSISPRRSPTPPRRTGNVELDMYLGGTDLPKLRSPGKDILKEWESFMKARDGPKTDNRPKRSPSIGRDDSSKKSPTVKGWVELPSGQTGSPEAKLSQARATPPKRSAGRWDVRPVSGQKTLGQGSVKKLGMETQVSSSQEKRDGLYSETSRRSVSGERAGSTGSITRQDGEREDSTSSVKRRDGEREGSTSSVKRRDGEREGSTSSVKRRDGEREGSTSSVKRRDGEREGSTSSVKRRDGDREGSTSSLKRRDGEREGSTSSVKRRDGESVEKETSEKAKKLDSPSPSDEKVKDTRKEPSKSTGESHEEATLRLLRQLHARGLMSDSMLQQALQKVHQVTSEDQSSSRVKDDTPYKQRGKEKERERDERRDKEKEREKNRPREKEQEKEKLRDKEKEQKTVFSKESRFESGRSSKTNDEIRMKVKAESYTSKSKSSTDREVIGTMGKFGPVKRLEKQENDSAERLSREKKDSIYTETELAIENSKKDKGLTSRKTEELAKRKGEASSGSGFMPRVLRKPAMDDPNLARPMLSSNQLAALRRKMEKDLDRNRDGSEEKSEKVDNGGSDSLEDGSGREGRRDAQKKTDEDLGYERRRRDETESSRNSGSVDRESFSSKSKRGSDERDYDRDDRDSVSRRKKENDDEVSDRRRTDSFGSGSKNVEEKRPALTQEELEKMIERRVQERLKKEEEKLKREAEEKVRESLRKERERGGGDRRSGFSRSPAPFRQQKVKGEKDVWVPFRLRKARSRTRSRSPDRHRKSRSSSERDRSFGRQSSKDPESTKKTEEPEKTGNVPKMPGLSQTSSRWDEDEKEEEDVTHKDDDEVEEEEEEEDNRESLTELEKFLKDLKQTKKKQWIAEGKIKDPE